MSLAAASKHVKVLENAGLIRREIRWRTHVCHLEPGPLARAHEWLGFYERFWTDRLDDLERLLREEDAVTHRNQKEIPMNDLSTIDAYGVLTDPRRCGSSASCPARSSASGPTSPKATSAAAGSPPAR